MIWKLGKFEIGEMRNRMLKRGIYFENWRIYNNFKNSCQFLKFKQF